MLLTYKVTVDDSDPGKHERPAEIHRTPVEERKTCI